MVNYIVSSLQENDSSIQNHTVSIFKRAQDMGWYMVAGIVKMFV
jgi:hypothetical protein